MCKSRWFGDQLILGDGSCAPVIMAVRSALGFNSLCQMFMYLLCTGSGQLLWGLQRE